MLGRVLIRKLGPLGVAITAGQAAMAAREHWNLLTPAERSRFQALTKESRGRRSNLSAQERQEMAELVRKLQLGTLGKRVAMSAAPIPGRRGRR